MKNSHCGLNESINFNPLGVTCKMWCQEHHVPVFIMNYWMRKLKTLDEQSDTDMIFAKMPTEKEI